jgi:hypothetical protein
MARLSHLLITLPLMAAPVFALGLKPVGAETATPLEALELLAKHSAADAKCNTLTAGEHAELNGYLARAEIATTARHSVDEARSAINFGRKSGEVASCGPVTADDVRATLLAAREAMAQVETGKKPRRTKQVASISKPRKQESQPAFPGKARPGGLNLYARHAMAYYVERRCRHLTRGETADFWRRIVGSYQSAVRSFGAGAVARAQRRAETEAGGWGCGDRSLKLVEAAYARSRRF